MATKGPKLLRRSSTLNIVNKNEVSPTEKEFHQILDNDVTGEEIEDGTEKNGELTPQDSPKLENWNKIAKSVNLATALNTAAPPLEEGGALELNAEEFRVGIPFRFKVHLEQLPGKTLIVTCDPLDGATIKIATHEKEGIVTYMCTLVPLKEGRFTIATLFGKKHVLGSPFEVNFNPAADASLCTMKEAPDECRTSVDKDTLTFCIYTNQEKEGTLTAAAKSLSGKKSVPVTISEPGKGHYDVEFDANDGKKYRLSIKFDNQHINGSPFLLHLSDATVCKVLGDGIVQGVVGQENHFDVATKGAGPGKLRVKVEGKSQAVVIIKPKEDDVYEVTYFPKKVGSYQITAMWLEEEVPGSPFVVNCFKPVGVTIPKPEKSSVYMVGECYKFKIDAKESGDGTLEANSVEEDSLKVNVTSLGKGQYRVDVTPQKTGTAHVSIRWRDRDLPGSPFPLEVDSKPNSNQITVSGPVFEVGSSNPVTLEISTEKAGAGKLKAKCASAKGKNIPVKVAEGQSKTHLISFEPPKQDIYTLWVTWSKTQVPGSPFTINLHPSNASNCHVVGLPIVPEDWQEPAILTISTASAGSGKLEMKAEGETSGILADEHIQMKENDAGETEIKLVAPSPDIYRVSVSWSGEPIPKSPFILNRIQPNAETCIATVSELGGDWQDNIYVNIDATAAGNGKFAAFMIGNTTGDVSKLISITPDETQPGKYVANFKPKQPDTYTMALEWSGKSIPGFPRKLNRNKYQPKKVKVLKKSGGVMKVGEDISIVVDTTDGGPGELTSTCSAEKGGDVPVTVEQIEENQYKAFFQLSAQDIYSLSVLWSGEHIHESPFTIDMIPVDASRVVASDPTFPQGLNGPVEITLSTEGAGAAEVTAVCIGGKSKRVKVDIDKTSSNKNIQKLSFIPPQPDFFTMGVKYGGTNINKSPFHINTHPPNASMVTVTQPENTCLGQSVNYLCDGSKAGHGTLSVTVTGNKCRQVESTIVKNETPKCTVHFLPQEPDIYNTSIKWEGEEVTGSPFVVNLLPLDAALVVAESVHIPDEAGSEYAYVTVDCSNVGVAPLLTSVFGDTTGDIKTEIEDLSNSCHNIKFIPPKDDKYTVSVLFNDVDIQGSPFMMSIISPQPDKVKLISTTIPNQLLPLVVLTFDTTEAGRGKMQASTRGHKSGEVNNHEVVESTPGNWRVSFIPPFPDTYDVSCLWAKRDIPHSPFQVNLESAVASEVVVGELHIPTEANTREEVWLDLDCSQAGHDVVRGTLEDTETFTKTQEAEIVSLGLKRYRLKVEPKEPRLYNFSVQYGRDHVQGSPFEVDLQLCIPDGVKIKEKSLPQYSDGREGYILVDTNQAGRGKLTASLRAKKHYNSIPLKLQEVDKKCYKIIFTPPSPDSYTLNIFWSDIPIPSSPHNFIVLLPICPEKVVCGELVGHGPGKTATLDVSTLNAGHAHLTATCEGEKNGLVNVNVATSKENADSHIVSFTPPIEDKYSLTVRYCGSEVPGSPFLLNLKLDPLKCFIFDDNDLKLPIHIDQEVYFGVDTTNGGYGKLRVSVIAPDGEQTSTHLNVTNSEKGKYYVSFTPTTKGLHQINLEWGFGHVPRSPIQFDVHEPAVPIYHNGKPITFQLKRMYSSLKELTALAAHVTSETKCNVEISQIRKGEFLLCFEAEKPGNYRVNILQNRLEIEGSPYYVHYARPANPSACVVSRLTDSVHIGETAEFTLDASKAGFGDISVRPDIPLSGMDSTINIRDNRNGTYIVQYTPQAVGQHRIHMLWSDKEVPESPFSLVVERLQNTEGLAWLVDGEAELFQEPHATEKPLKFVIEAPDRSSGKLAVSCHGPGKPELRVEDNNDHTYTCHLVSAEPGNYWIHILWNRRHIEGSPFLLTIIPKKAIKVLGLNANEALPSSYRVHIKEEDKIVFESPQSVGTDVLFCLVTGCTGKGELSVSCSRPGNPEIDVHDNFDGTHSCTLSVSEQGEYKVYILWEKKHIDGSPFSISFLPSKAMKVLGLNPNADPGLAPDVTIMEKDMVLFTEPQSVETMQFSIQTPAGRKGELCVSAKGPDEISVKLIDVKEEFEGVQTCLLSPTTQGEYSVYILWDKIHIPGSPFSVRFTNNKARKLLGIYSSNRDLSNSELARVHIIPKDVEEYSKPLPLDVPIKFHVSTKRAGKGILTLTTQGPGKPKVKIGEVKDNVCVCTIRTSIAGKYMINLLWNNERVDENPYELVFESEQRQIIGIDLDNIVLPLKQTHKFKVFYTEVGEGEFKMFCHPSDAAELSVSPLSSEGYYLCELTPQIAGNHDLVIQYNDRDILGSPFTVHFHSENLPPLILPTPPIPHNIRVSGPGISGGRIGQEGNFVVDTTNAGVAKLDFEVVGPYGGFTAQLRQHWENKRVLLARYDPTFPGEYRLVMRWAGIEIPGSPFEVTIDDPK